MKSGLKLVVFLVCVTSLSCMSAYKKSVGGDTQQSFTKVYLSEYPLAWESAVEALKASPMEIVNRENGTLQTKWIENTAEKNRIDSAGSVIPYTKAQYRFRVTVAKGFYQGQNSVRVTAQKEQQIQRDVLEGWVSQETDGIQENSLMYRIGKIIDFKKRVADLENKNLQRQIEKATQEVNPGSP